MTLRLLVLAGDNWARFDGWATARGLDAAEMPLPRFCHLVGFWATEGAQSEADVKKFEAALWRPPVSRAWSITRRPCSTPMAGAGVSATGSR